MEERRVVRARKALKHRGHYSRSSSRTTMGSVERVGSAVVDLDMVGIPSAQLLPREQSTDSTTKYVFEGGCIPLGCFFFEGEGGLW